MRGASQTSPWVSMCPADEVVVGFTGTSGSGFDQVAFVCAPLSAPEAGAGDPLSIGPTTTLASVGGSGSDAYQDACPSGQVARGSNSRSGEWVDAFGLVCGTPTLSLDGGGS